MWTGQATQEGLLSFCHPFPDPQLTQSCLRQGIFFRFPRIWPPSTSELNLHFSHFWLLIQHTPAKCQTHSHTHRTPQSYHAFFWSFDPVIFIYSPHLLECLLLVWIMTLPPPWFLHCPFLQSPSTPRLSSVPFQHHALPSAFILSLCTDSLLTVFDVYAPNRLEVVAASLSLSHLHILFLLLRGLPCEPPDCCFFAKESEALFAAALWALPGPEDSVPHPWPSPTNHLKTNMALAQNEHPWSLCKH